MDKINKLDKLNIYASASLSPSDLLSLSLLYQPLIGSEALGLYMLFSSLLEKSKLASEALFHYNVYDILGIKEAKFLEMRKKLEAIGLIETFYKNDEFTYLVKSPLSPKEFLCDSTFGSYLYNKVGEGMFHYLTDRFIIEKFNRESYDNVTTSFDKVFSSEIPDVIINANNVLYEGRKNNTKITISDFSFNIESFIKEIDESLLENGVTDSFKKIIVNTSFLYGFDIGDMISLYNQSLGKNGYFDERALKKKAQMLFKFKTNSLAPNLKTKPLSEEDNFLLETLKNTPVSLILDKFWPNYPSAYLQTIEQAYQQIELPREVITIMIFKILKIKNGELPNIAYLKKVASSWISEGIDTAEIAFAYITSEKNDNTYDRKDQVRKKTVNRKTNVEVDKYAKNIKEGFDSLDE